MYVYVYISRLIAHLGRYGLEGFEQELSPAGELLAQERLAVEVEQVEGEDADGDGDRVELHVLLLARREHLPWNSE